MKRRIVAFFDKVWVDMAEDLLDSQKALEAHKDANYDKRYPTKLDFKDMLKIEQEISMMEIDRIKNSIYSSLCVGLILFIVSLILFVEVNDLLIVAFALAFISFILSILLLVLIYKIFEMYYDLRDRIRLFYERKERYIQSIDIEAVVNCHNLLERDSIWNSIWVRGLFYGASFLYMIFCLLYSVYLFYKIFE